MYMYVHEMYIGWYTIFGQETTLCVHSYVLEEQVMRVYMYDCNGTRGPALIKSRG